MKIELKHPDFKTLLPADMQQRVMERTARDAQRAIQDYYSELPENWFDSTRSSFPDGTPKHGQARTFMRALTQHWRAVGVSRSSFALQFRHNREGGSPWGLRLQEYGGVIKAAKARALTIPLTAEARGVRVRDFEARTQRRLFALKPREQGGGKKGTLMWRDESGLHAAYALRDSVEIKPLKQRRRHHAIPTAWQLGRMVRPLFVAALKEELSKK